MNLGVANIPEEILTGALENLDKELNTNIQELYNQTRDLNSEYYYWLVNSAYTLTTQYPVNNQKEVFYYWVGKIFNQDLLSKYYLVNPVAKSNSQIFETNGEIIQPEKFNPFSKLSKQTEEVVKPNIKNCCVCGKPDYSGLSQKQLETIMSKSCAEQCLRDGSRSKVFKSNVHFNMRKTFVYYVCEDECLAKLEICTPFAYESGMYLVHEEEPDEILNIA